MLRLLVLLVIFDFASFAESVPARPVSQYVLTFDSVANAKRFHSGSGLLKVQITGRYVGVRANRLPDLKLLKPKAFGLVGVRPVKILTQVELTATGTPDFENNRAPLQQSGSGTDETFSTGGLGESMKPFGAMDGSSVTCQLIGNTSDVRSHLNASAIQSANLDLMNKEMANLKKEGIRVDSVHIGLVDGNITKVADRFGGTVSVGNQFPRSNSKSLEAYDEHTDHGVEVTDTLLTASPGSVVQSWQSFDGPNSTDVGRKNSD